MYFKKLELYGFKSFVDKTELTFEPGTTAIVGPNGCGKTNISDSIRWVLGEQSAKSLRGGKMEDVIFNGTDYRKPLSMAEVSITLGQVRGLLPIDSDDVTVTRRVYRSGESEYLINGHTMRLKDIDDLFADTGVGTNAYSVLEQGKMDMILQAKPADRRYLFEEAAGISKYKTRKEEALRKLDSTEQNLVRISDIVQEIKRQINSLERQAKKAQRYQEISSQLKTSELQLIAFDARRLTQERREADTRQGALQQRLAELSRTLAEADAGLESHKQELLHREGVLKERTIALHECERAIQQAEHHIALNRGRKATLQEVREKSAPEVERAQKHLEDLTAQLAHLTDLQQRLQQDQQHQQQHFQDLERQLAGMELPPHETRLATLRVDSVSLMNDLSGMKSHVAELEASKRELMGRLASVGQEMTRLEQQQQELDELGRIFDRFEQDLSGDLLTIAHRGRTLVRSIQQALSGHWEESTTTLQSIRSELMASHEKFEVEIRQRLEVLHAKEADYTALSEEIQKLEEFIRHLTDQRTSVSQNIMHTKTTLVSLEERAKHQTVEHDRLHRALDEARQELHRRQHDLGSNLQREGEFESEATKHERSLEDLLKQHTGLRAHTSESEEEVTRLREHLAQKESGLKDLRVELSSKDQERHQLDMTLTRTDMELKSLWDHLDNTYHITEADLPVLTEEQLTQDRDTLKTHVHELRQKIDELGPVNLVAMEEYQELAQRYEFLSKQEEDLRQAKTSLTQTIHTINQTTRTMFAEAFEKIRENFKLIFRRLFQGGEADLLLLDEEQVLESGIEIFARPPGKKLQSITLLSGGERALTAIALLFALFKLKASPFCVLDEIDAPLDDTNVRRFTHMLKEFAKDTQFIIITHSKLTMEESDTLYGVTMQEPGASKIVSVKFKEGSTLPQAVTTAN